MKAPRIFRLLLLIVCIASFSISSALAYANYVVIAKSGLNLRTSARIDAKKILTIPYCATVKWYQQGRKSDSLEIAGEKGVWLEVEYNKRWGFVFSAYLRKIPYENWLVESNGELNLDFMIIHEGEAMTDEESHKGIYFNPNFHWYGLYETQDKDFDNLKKVEIQLLFKEDQTDEPLDSFSDIYNYYGSLPSIKTNLKERALFLIGARAPLKEDLIPSNHYITEESFGTRILPYQNFNLQIKGITPLGLRTNCKPKFEKAEHNPNPSFIGITVPLIAISNIGDTWQLLDELSISERGDDYHNTLEGLNLTWYGDLDNDRKIDLIFMNYQTEDSEYDYSGYQLFLSSQAQEGDILKMVAESFSGGF